MAYEARWTSRTSAPRALAVRWSQRALRWETQCLASYSRQPTSVTNA